MRRLVALATGLLLVAAACDEDSSSVPTTSLPAPTTPTTRPARGNVDGVLTLGVLLPSSGPASGLGASMSRGVELAVSEINRAGGVNGRPVRLVLADEGTGPATAAEAVDTLLVEQEADVIIGPASARVALTLLDQVVRQDALVCSPSNSAIALSDFPDRGLYFRTMPSDSLQAKALARAIAGTGLGTASVLYPNDDYGRRFAELLTSDLEQLEVGVVASIPYDTSSDAFGPVARRALDPAPEALAVLGPAQPGGEVLAALRQAGAPPDRVPTFVTDAMRRADLSDQVEAGRPTSVTGITGTAPAAVPTSATWFLDALGAFAPGTSASYASYAYDCANLVALASLATGSDDPLVVRQQMAPISRSGGTCRNFVECAPLVNEGRNVDLEGASGPIDLSDTGDPSGAIYDQFTFDETGRDVLERQLVVNTG